MHKFQLKTEDLEQYFLEVMNGKRRRWFDRTLLMLLFFMSRFFSNIAKFRLWLYDSRIIRHHSLGCLVVSIGNLTCGGTGKTPVVEVFARSLSQQGRKVAILSRGYRSKNRSFWEKMRQKFNSEHNEIPPKVVSDGKNLLMDCEYAGDEPYMLASNLPDVAVLVDKDRVKSGIYAINHFQTDVIILDDGFQYLMLRPHINIVLVDSTAPFGNGHCLPRGTLREPVEHIKRADYIFLTKSTGTRRNRHLKRFLNRHCRKAEIIECCHKPQYLQKLFSQEHVPLESLKGVKTAALSAIASPGSFEGFLRKLGADLVLTDHYADHHRYTQQEIIDFINQAKAAGAEMIVTTEKDAVRIPKLDRCDVPLYFLRIQIDILSGMESFEECISRICFIDEGKKYE